MIQVEGTPVDQTAGIETAIAGVYGTLFIQADGTYRYVLDSASGLADGEIATETFDYLAANGAGADNEDSAVLTIVIQGDGGPDVPIVTTTQLRTMHFPTTSKTRMRSSRT